MKIKSRSLSVQQGFSLVELLVVIAVIAIIAAIAIPNIANITKSATDAKNQRNAQSIASVASAAIAAGYTNWTSGGSIGAIISDLTNGIDVTNNSGNVMHFGISTMSENEIAGATNYVTFDGTSVNYNPAITPSGT